MMKGKTVLNDVLQLLQESVLIACLVTLLFVITSAPQVEAQIPWGDSDEVAARYAIWRLPQTSSRQPLVHVIWDMVRNEAAAELEGIHTGASSAGGSPVFLVPGHPQVAVYADLGAFDLPETQFGMAQNNFLSRIGSPTKYPSMTLQSCPTCAEVERNVIQGNRLPGPFLSRDLASVIYFQNGDLWTGFVNWGEGTVSDQRQVTQVGLFGVEGRPVLHWYEDQVFLEGGFSEERPIVRIDLGTGELEELPRGNVFVPASRGRRQETFATPSGRFLCNSMGELLACYDVQEARRFRISLLPVHDANRVPRANRVGELFQGPDRDRDHGANVTWIDEDRALSWTNGVVGMVDFATETSRAVYTHELTTGNSGGIWKVELLPGMEHALIFLTEYGFRGRSSSIQLKRLSLSDGSLTDLPSLEAAGSQGPVVRWLDPERFIFSKSEGGLTEIGTWLYNFSTGDSRRICGAPVNFSILEEPWKGVVVGPTDVNGEESAYFYSIAQGGDFSSTTLGCLM